MNLEKIKTKIEDHMLLGSIYDNIMMKVKYNDYRLSFYYNVMIAQKHRMLFYKRLKKEFFDSVSADRFWENLPKEKNSDTIWFCWMQGLDNAPEIVKACYESLKIIKNKNIVVLDEKNIADYIELPEFIIEKWKKGIIGHAHFSDIVRLAVLNKHGGYWIDSTVFCTSDRLFEDIDKTELFMPSFYYFGFNPEIMLLNNWFIYSTTNNNILSMEYEFLIQYWKKYDRAVNYFFFHLFMTMCCEYYEEDYNNMPIVSQAPAHLLATYIYDSFDQLKYDMLCKETGIHKLSTRFEQEKLGEGTFYDKVIRANN